MDPLHGLCTILIITPKVGTFDKTNLTKISAWVSIVSPMLLHLILFYFFGDNNYLKRGGGNN
jgi:hypothetical protein